MYQDDIVTVFIRCGHKLTCKQGKSIKKKHFEQRYAITDVTDNITLFHVGMMYKDVFKHQASIHECVLLPYIMFTLPSNTWVLIFYTHALHGAQNSAKATNDWLK